MNIYQEAVLNNSLKIITSEHPGSDLVTVSLWVRAGSRYEDVGQRGLAHLLEHMMFKRAGILVDHMGALSKASTSEERIYFFIQAAKQYLAGIFAALADTALNPQLDHSVLENEKKVVMQEFRQMTEDPAQLVRYEAMRAAFREGPLSRGPLGDAQTVISATTEGVRRYYEQFFAPDRALLVVTGDITSSESVSLAKKYFGAWKGFQSEQDAPLGSAVAARGYEVRRAQSAQAHVAMNFVAPHLAPTESLAMDCFGSFLAYGQSSLLMQELRHKKGAVYQIAAFDKNYRDASTFFIQTATDRPTEVIDTIISTVGMASERCTAEAFADLKRREIAIFLRRIGDPRLETKFFGENWTVYDKLIRPEEVTKFLSSMRHEDFLATIGKSIKISDAVITILGEENIREGETGL